MGNTGFPLADKPVRVFPLFKLKVDNEVGF